MFEEGNIIYFKPYVFLDGKTPSKNKYCLVLKVLPNLTSILVVLPSSQKHIPQDLQGNVYGCFESPLDGLGFFAFRAGDSICENGFSFPLDTFIYGQHLNEFDSALIQDEYPYEGIHYEILGKLTTPCFDAVISCLSQSKAVKNKYRKILLAA